jgi:hypothetical protein
MNFKSIYAKGPLMGEIYKYLFIIGSSIISFWILSVALRSILLLINPELNQKITRKIQLKDPGTWIGLSEFLLILIFVFLAEYTTIAIIFAAKEIVRSDDIKKNASYYLLGTLLNVVLSLLSSLLIKGLTWRLFP